uniref:PCI domain-containing protein 2 n=1 Tax=Eptatretus burgeri TaxID=7764 RepID=A0A8C4QM78_EPTBU
MAHVTLNQYLKLLSEAIDTRNGMQCAELLSFNHAHVANVRLQVLNPEQKCQDAMEPPYDEMAAAHLRCTRAVANNDFVEAYKYQTIVVQYPYSTYQPRAMLIWVALPIMNAVTLDLRIFANYVSVQLRCSRAGIEDSKKWGMLFLVNQLFKIYFKINKLHLCKPLIRAIDSSQLRDSYTMAQRITFKYYVGRKAMFDSDFKQAEDYLSFAFAHCHRDSQKNKRMVLIYLLPVKMLLVWPLLCAFLKSDSLNLQGRNLLLLNDALNKHETFFIRCGIFLILEKLKIITYRNLFKKVYLLLKTHLLPLGAFLVALQFMKVENVDLDEVQCLLANLIFNGHIKGYISHQHQKLVVSKQNPFPPLSSIS